MANSKDLQIVLSAVDNVSSGLKAVQVELNNLGTASTEVAVKQESMSASVTRGLVNFELLKQGLEDVGRFVADCVKGYGDLQVSIDQAAINVKNSGLSWDSVKDKLIGYSQSMTNLGFTQEDTINSVSRLMMNTKDYQKAIELNNLAMDTARSRHTDLNSATTMLEKALAGTTIGLRYYGVSLDKGASSAEILDAIQQKVKGSAEAYAQTMPGMLDTVNAKWKEGKDTIGEALLPEVEKLMGLFIQYMPQITEGLIIFADIISGLVQIFIDITKVVEGFFELMADRVIGAIDFWKSFGEDVVNIFKNIGRIGEEVFTAFKDFITGNFSGAADEMKKAMNDAFSNTIESMQVTADVQQDTEKKILSSFADIGRDATATWKSFSNAGKQATDAVGKGIKDLSNDGSSDFTGLGKAGKDAAAAAQNAFDNAVANMKQKFSDIETAGVASLDAIGTKIQSLSQQMQDAYWNKQKDENAVSSDIGTAYVAEQQKLLALKKDLNDKNLAASTAFMSAGGASKAPNDPTYQQALIDLNDAQNKYNQEATMLDKYSYIAKDYATQVADANKKANQSDLQNALDTARQKLDQINIDYANKVGSLNKELSAEVEKYNNVQALMKKAFDQEKAFNNLKVEATKETVNAQIKMYNELAKAMTAAAAGKQTSLISSEIVNKDLALAGAAYQSTPINVNISGNNIVGAGGIKDVANMVSKELANNLKLNTQFAN